MRSSHAVEGPLLLELLPWRVKALSTRTIRPHRMTSYREFLCQPILPSLNRLLRNLLPQRNRVEGFILRQPPYDCQLCP